jgi:hypothetical protein
VATKEFKKEFADEMGFQWRPWRWASKGLGIIVMLMIVGALLGAAVWAIGVATSDTAGKGNQIKQNNSNQNRTYQQQNFEDLFAQIKVLDRKITLAQQTMDADSKAGKDTTIDQQNLLGAQNVCLEAVGTYDADSRKVLAADWRSSDLPKEIDQNDPSTDCKPNAA